MQHEQQHIPSATAEPRTGNVIQLSTRERRTWLNEPRTLSNTDRVGKGKGRIRREKSAVAKETKETSFKVSLYKQQRI